MTIILNRGGEAVVGRMDDGHFGDVDVTTLSDNTYLVAWAPSDHFVEGIYLQHLSATGLPLGDPFSIYDSGHVRTAPTIVALADGGYAVTFVDGPDNYPTTKIFTAAGVLTETVSYTFAAGETASSSLSNQGHVHVFTILVGSGSTVAGLYFHLFTAADNMLGGSTLINTSGNVPVNPAVAGLANGTMAVVWAEVVPEVGYYNIFTRLFTDTGVALGPVSQIETPVAFHRIRPDIVALETGYVVTWQQEGDGGDRDIYAQVLDDNGQAVGDMFRVTEAPDGQQTMPSMAALDDGGFVVTWTAMDNDGSGLNIHARHFDANGHAVGPEERVNSIVNGTQDDSRVTAVAGGGYVIVWNDETAKTISMRTYSPTGSLNGAQVLYGTADSDTLDGGSGNDAMYGGWGDDTYMVNAAGDTVGEDANGGNDTVMASVAYMLGANLENLVLTGFSALSGTGNALSNIMTGNAGNNSLSGLYADDFLYGGNGNDKLDGGAGNDFLYGESGNDTLQASTGIDYLDGGSGVDTFAAVTTGGSAVINLATGKATQGAGNTAWLISVENATGGDSADTLTGNSDVNVFDGGAGADTLSGGLGDDTYYVDNSGDIVTESSNAALGGINTVYASVDYALTNYTENLILIGTAITGNGEGHANTITGNAGNNLIDGKAGNDTMIGGLGDDTYWVDVAGDVVVETAGQGTDTVRAGLTYTLGVNIENLVLTGTANFDGTGNADANVITGNAGSNSLDGKAGADTMTGGKGDDTYVIDDTGDNVVEINGEGTDTILSSVTYTLSGRFVETLQLTGSGNINAAGNSQQNTLVGNTGNNSLTGGGGADVFKVLLNSHTDTITDFTSSQGDSIDATAYHAVSHLVYLSGTSVIIDFGGGNTVTVLHATVTDVTVHTVF